MLFHQFLHAPEFPQNATWLNTDQPLSLEKLAGQVVVLDFWTYCCINCIHILPDLKYIEEKYADAQVAIVGVHSAKFLNEQNVQNIQSAVSRYEISHPVVIDNQHRIWDSYGVRAWPTFVVIDTKGFIRAHYSGEGHREELDYLIHQLIVEGRKAKSLAKEKIKITNSTLPLHNTLSFPGKIFVSSDREPANPKKEIFISDSNHHRILHCELNSPTEAHVIQVIGSGKAGSNDGLLSSANFRHPQGLCAIQDQLFVCDTENHLIRKVDLTRRIVETVAGTEHQAEWGAHGGEALTTALNSPWDITADTTKLSEDMTLYVAMAGAHQIWQFQPYRHVIDIYAGNGRENIVDGSARNAQLAQPSGITFDNGQIYIADSEVSAIRQINPLTRNVQTVVGHGLFTFGLQDGPLEEALFQHPLGLDAEKEKIYVADTYNHALRVINLATSQVSTLLHADPNHRVCMIGDKNCDLLPLYEPNDVKKLDHYLYIADTNNHLVRVFNLETQTLEDLKITGMS